jgi:hypothetical protein
MRVPASAPRGYQEWVRVRACRAARDQPRRALRRAEAAERTIKGRTPPRPAQRKALRKPCPIWNRQAMAARRRLSRRARCRPRMDRRFPGQSSRRRLSPSFKPPPPQQPPLALAPERRTHRRQGQQARRGAVDFRVRAHRHRRRDRIRRRRVQVPVLTGTPLVPLPARPYLLVASGPRRSADRRV